METKKRKQPLNAYILFYREILQEVPQFVQGRDHKKFSVLWKNMASEDKQLYFEEAARLNELHVEKTSMKVIKSAKGLFKERQRMEIKKQFPCATVKEIRKHLRGVYKGVSKEEKSKFVEEFKELKKTDITTVGNDSETSIGGPREDWSEKVINQNFIDSLKQKMAIENSGKGTTENEINLTAVLSNHNPKSNDRHKKNHKRGIEPVRLFCKERRREFRKMYPEANTTEITKQMSIAWKNLSEVEKQPFQTKYMRLKAEMKSNPPESSMTSLDAELLPPPVTSGRSTPKYLDAYQSDHSELHGPTSLVVTPPFNYFSRLSSPIESLWTPPSESISTDYYRTTSFSSEPHFIPSSESLDYSRLEPNLDFSNEDNKSEIPDDLKDINITLPMIPEWEIIFTQL